MEEAAELVKISQPETFLEKRTQYFVVKGFFTLSPCLGSQNYHWGLAQLLHKVLRMPFDYMVSGFHVGCFIVPCFICSFFICFICPMMFYCLITSLTSSKDSIVLKKGKKN